MKSKRPAWFKAWETVQYALLGASMLAVILPIVLITYYLVKRGLPAISWEFLTAPPKEQMTAGGIMPPLIGTFYLILGTFLFALPLGLFGAVFITEYGRRSKFTRVLRLAIVNLAGVPSVVYGLFGLGFFVVMLGGGIDRTFYHAPQVWREDLVDPLTLTQRVEAAADPLAQFLKPSFDPTTFQLNKEYEVSYNKAVERLAAEAAAHPERPGKDPLEEKEVKVLRERLQDKLATHLNKVLQAGPIYSPERFPDAASIPDLQAQIQKNPQGPELAQLNRALLESSFSQEITTFRRLKFGTGSLIWASLTLALLILPVVITASEEALLSVPDSFRQASLALGCTKWQTIWRVVLPNALPGVITGMILGISRAAGETAPILLVGASFFLPTLPDSIHSPFMALPYHLYIMATQATNAPDRIPWGTALVLLGLVLGLNGVASLFRARARANRKW